MKNVQIITYSTKDLNNPSSAYFSSRCEDEGEIGNDLEDFGLTLEKLQDKENLSLEKIHEAFTPLESYIDRLYVGWNGQISWVPKKKIYPMVISHYLLNFGSRMPSFHVLADLFEVQVPTTWKSFPPYPERPVYCQAGNRRMAIFRHGNDLHAFVWSDQYPEGEWGVVTQEELAIPEQKTITPAEFYQPQINMELLLAPLYKHAAF